MAHSNLILGLKFLFFIILTCQFSYLGLILYFIILQSFFLIIEFIYKCEKMSGADSLYMYEYEKSPNIIITNLIVDKITPEELTELIRENIVLKFKRMRQKVLSLVNEFFWKEVKDISEILKNIKIVKEKFIDRQQVFSLNEKLFSVELDLNKPQWEVYFIQNYEALDDVENKREKSVIILKLHHSIGDGIAFVNLLSSSCIDYDLSRYSQLKKISTWKRIFLNLLAPYLMIKVLPKIDKNVLNPFIKYAGICSGEKKIGVTKNYKFADFKRVYSSYENCTFNDLSWTIISRALIKWANTKAEVKFNSISGLMAISARTNIDQLSLGNESAGMVVSLYNKNSFQESLDYTQKTLTPLKNKNALIGASKMMSVFAGLFLNEKFIKNAAQNLNNISFIYTNVQGPSKKVHFKLKNNKCIEVNDILPFVPHGNLVLSILTFSYNGYIRFALHDDKIKGPPLEELISYLDEEIERSLNY